MRKVRYGTATAFGIFDAIYQLIAGVILILFCTKLGGIPYGIALVLSALATGAFVVLASKKLWARRTVLFLGLAQLFLIFALGMIIDKLDGMKYVAENGVFALRVLAFYSGATLTISGVMFTNLHDEDNAFKLTVTTAAYKLASVVGVAASMIVPALLTWQKSFKKGFNEWLLSRGGENPDADLLLEEFELFVENWGPAFAGIGALLIALVPTYVWFLDSQNMLGERSFKRTVILDCIAAPFFLFAEWTLLADFLDGKKIVSIVFMALIVLCYAGLWFLFYVLSKELGWCAVAESEETAEIAEAKEEVCVIKTVE